MDADKDRLAIVTGGASGIGEGLAISLAESGYRVAIIDQNINAADNVACTIRAAGFFASAFQCDLTHYGSIGQVLHEVVGSLGSPWLLVNNVGGDSPKPFLQTTPDDWEFLINLNLKCAFNITHQTLPLMIAAGGGRVVNISSDSARVGIPGVSVYASCKGGIIAFSKCLAREMAPHDILVNTVCPGVTETPALQAIMEDGGSAWVNRIVDQIPLGRMGVVGDYGPMVVFLAGEGANYITGQTFSISGGKSMI